MEDELLKYLYDIREAASAILRFVRGKTFDEYEQDELLRGGVERKFEILGEALNRIRKDNPALLGKIREHATSRRSGISSYMATTASTTRSYGTSSKKTWVSYLKM